ncbi:MULTISPECIES: hypothetical protein [Calothrix]|uniref:Uncharacterized protein n=2 Tax=Calothrix TaxID=1186 RepID=A0ABR8A7R3_9CYAN|nr:MULTISPECIES: hypothetical protein [Calothrix]MBD2195961.1 hypothetical protein [Calothrix parietina FACHB-288]MBD2224549.1 hypothetical protein [Calothrix anomala FACHB-343]
MRSQFETQIISTLIKGEQIGQDYLIETSCSIFSPKGDGEIIAWENMSFPKLSKCGSFFDGAYNVPKAAYDDWVLMNRERYLFKNAIANSQVTLISDAEANRLCADYNYRWANFYWLTRPGFSPDFSQALIQLAAYCPSSPNYASILYLERNNNQWETKSSFGLYNQ